ncbi:uncharacterized protein LOC122548258 [Chiloscyllium plagiosum]|uniref:uncharacterized protein LOC122548258 n=1 Tax=Chiloscyllium plagiosum TaxID=36176 RepID=UPI001CB852C7|nr:uncharacterized protein LOC122548258 [Chiloscyllium plagiosum]
MVGRASEVFAVLSDEGSRDYAEIKQAVLSAYELVLEAYRQRLRGFYLVHNKLRALEIKISNSKLGLRLLDSKAASGKCWYLLFQVLHSEVVETECALCNNGSFSHEKFHGGGRSHFGSFRGTTHSCQNGGTWNGHKCDCKENYVGSSCEFVAETIKVDAICLWTYSKISNSRDHNHKSSVQEFSCAKLQKCIIHRSRCDCLQQIIDEDEHLTKTLPAPPLLAFKRPPNLKQIMVRSKPPRLQDNDTVQPCHGNRCKMYQSIDMDNTIIHGDTFQQVRSKYSCDSANMLYLIGCRQGCPQSDIALGHRQTSHLLCSKAELS